MKTINLEDSKLCSKQSLWLTEQLEGYNVCFVGIHGSKLYGLDHENSDTDIKAIYLPSKMDLLLGNAVKTINKKNDDLNIEIEIKSLSSFLKSTEKCDTNCVDLLHSPENMVLYKTELWNGMVKHRKGIYAKNMKGIVCYIKTHTYKYTTKIDRLKEMKQIKNMIAENFWGRDNDTVGTFANEFSKQLSEMRYTNIVTLVKDHEQQYLEVCGKKYIFTWSVSQLNIAMSKEISRYGRRSNEGIGKGLDTKSLSHALRVLLELKEIITTRNIEFPLKNSGYIKAVKMGEITNVQEVMEQIDTLYEECVQLLDDSDLPEEVNLFEMYKVVEDYYFN